MVGVALVATLALAGCAKATEGSSNPAPPSTGGGSVKQQTSTDGFEERKITLSDGRTITCLTWVDSGYQYENTAAGLSCDWPKDEGPSE